jgi:hypothetical protein
MQRLGTPLAVDLPITEVVGDDYLLPTSREQKV